MRAAVVIAQLQRHRIGLAAHAADILDRQVARRQRQARLGAQRASRRSGTKATLTSLRETARIVAAVTRRNSSSGVVSLAGHRIRRAQCSLPPLPLDWRQLLAEAALVVLGHAWPLELVALVEEGDAEGEARSSLKIWAFSAQVITVRGDITVEMSPAMKPARVRSASATMADDRSCGPPRCRRPAPWPARCSPRRRAAGSSAWRRCSSGPSGPG